MAPQMNEEQILESLDKLSFKYKRKALRKLIGDLGELERIVERNQQKLVTICKKRGINFYNLSEDQREELIDRIIHEE